MVRPTYFIPTTISRNSNLSSIFIGPSCSYQISIFWSINGGSIILSGEICLGQNHLRAGTANQTKINCVFSSLHIVFHGPPFLSQLCFPFQSLHVTYLVLGCGLYPYDSFFCTRSPLSLSIPIFSYSLVLAYYFKTNHYILWGLKQPNFITSQFWMSEVWATPGSAGFLLQVSPG